MFLYDPLGLSMDRQTFTLPFILPLQLHTERKVYRELVSKAETVDSALMFSLTNSSWSWNQYWWREITQTLATEHRVALPLVTYLPHILSPSQRCFLAKDRRIFFLCLRLITLATFQHNRKLGFWPCLTEQRIKTDIFFIPWLLFISLEKVSHALETLLLQDLCYAIIYKLKLKHLLIKLSIFSPPTFKSSGSPESDVFQALLVTAAEAQQNTAQAADSSLSSTSCLTLRAMKRSTAL